MASAGPASLQTWAEADDRPRLVEQVVAKDDPDPTALACYGLLLRADPADGQASAELWLRFVDGRPVCPVIIGCRHESQLSVPEKVA